MSFSTTTVYTKERMLAYQLYYTTHLWRVWIVLGIAAVAAFLYLFLCVLSGFSEWLFNLLTVLLWGILLTTVFLYFILPRTKLNSSHALGAVVDYTFDEQGFSVHTKIEGRGEETASLLYSALQRVCRTASGQLYLFINKNAAYIVDTTPWTDEQRGFVLHMLKQALGDDNIR